MWPGAAGKSQLWRRFYLLQHMYYGLYSPVCHLYWSQMPCKTLPWLEFSDISVLLCASPCIHSMCIHMSLCRIYTNSPWYFSLKMVLNNVSFYNNFLITNFARTHWFHWIRYVCIHNYKLKILKIILNYQASLHCL